MGDKAARQRTTAYLRVKLHIWGKSREIILPRLQLE